MKVIQELVAYFDRRSRLAPDELKRLGEQGLLANEAPRTMVDYGDQIGATFFFRICGALTGQVWGTDVYTGDSELATTAVHAGLLKPDETGVLRVLIVDPPARFAGSLRNGVTSHDFERYGSAYRLERI